MSNLAFICHPFEGKEENLESTKKYCKYVIREDRVPISPALHYPQFLDKSDIKQREMGMEFGKELLKRCDEIWVCGDILTFGMKEELVYNSNLTEPKRVFFVTL